MWCGGEYLVRTDHHRIRRRIFHALDVAAVAWYRLERNRVGDAEDDDKAVPRPEILVAHC